MSGTVTNNWGMTFASEAEMEAWHEELYGLH